MEPFSALTAIAAPLDELNLDTNQLSPTRFNKVPYNAADYSRILLHDRRFRGDGTEIAEFVLNREPYRRARILVGDRNFGCGSSRESAAMSLKAFGVRVVIAPSFGDIFSKNCAGAGVVLARVDDEAAARLRRLITEKPGTEITVDLAAQTIAIQSVAADGDGQAIHFDISPLAKSRLLKGLDAIQVVRGLLPEIEAFERQYLAATPWLAPPRITAP